MAEDNEVTLPLLSFDAFFVFSMEVMGCRSFCLWASSKWLKTTM
jgi:hypothetical protein